MPCRNLRTGGENLYCGHVPVLNEIACPRRLYFQHALLDRIGANCPIVATIIWASTLVYPNVLGVFLFPLILLAFCSLIVGLAIASKKHENTSRSAWTLLAVAGVAQVATLIGLQAFRG
jgi:hypothetical protein